MPIERASTQLVDEVNRMKGRIGRRSDNNIEADFGSRFSLRMFGLGRPSTYADLPMKADIILRDKGAVTSIEVKMRSDEGWYLFRLPRLAEVYRSSFESRAQKLRDATGT